MAICYEKLFKPCIDSDLKKKNFGICDGLRKNPKCFREQYIVNRQQVEEV